MRRTKFIRGKEKKQKVEVILKSKGYRKTYLCGKEEAKDPIILLYKNQRISNDKYI